MYTPKAGPNAADKFKVVKCSVVPMAALLTKLEGLLGLDPGEGASKLLGPEDSELDANTVRFFIHRMCSGMDDAMLHNGSSSLQVSQ